jgi:hypothetical protein
VALLGRTAGIEPSFVGELAREGVHVHLHGVARTPAGREWIAEARQLAGARLHEEGPVGPADWVAHLSGYEGGLLHRFRSGNGGDVRLASWDDLNQPARVSTLLAVGVPLLQAASPGAAVHVQDLVRDTGAGLLYEDAAELAARLRQEAVTGAARAAAMAARPAFAFEHHAERVVGLFRAVAASPN